jgi:hypothetical protein
VSKQHILIDACVAAAFYAPKTTRSAVLVERATKLFTGRSPSQDYQLLMPNFCIGETFAVFEKYRWGASWNEHVNERTRLGTREFNRIRRRFHVDIQNGARIMQVELNRYHILCLDLIAPINAAYRISRDRRKGKRKQRKPVRPASTYDLLFVAMGMWLQKQLGSENFVMATGDQRISLIVKRARSVSLRRSMRRHLMQVSKRIGLSYGSDVYPNVIDLVRARKGELRQWFQEWTPVW